MTVRGPMEVSTVAVPAIVMSREEYEQLVLGDPDRPWEIIGGQLREKPAMSYAHNYGSLELRDLLRDQLDRNRYYVSVNLARLHNPHDTYVIPDIVVIPVDLTLDFRARPRSVEIYVDPVPLVAEFLSPSTGKYDVEGKLEAYKERGDREIWIVHPDERWLTAWRRRPGGTYDDLMIRSGTISPIALPGVTIVLEDFLI
jgi:Uma2 family endonuclease